MKTIIAAFRDQPAADQAIAFLHNRGVTDIELMDRDIGDQTPFEHLRELDVPDERARLYVDVMQRGAPVLAAHADRDAEQLAEELDRLGSIDVETGIPARAAEEEREASMRTRAADEAREASMRTRAKEEERERLAETSREQAAAQATSLEGRDLEIVEERVVVGKREVPRGGVRVRTFVIERPVHENVELREEHINISREKVNEPISPAEAEASLAEKEYVITATGEEAVVGKEARVVERVHIGKEAETRTEAIEDVERRQDVEVEPTTTAEPAPRNKR